MQTYRVFRLESPGIPDARRLLGEMFPKELAEAGKSVVVTVTREGRFYDPRYGEFDITREMLLSMVDNFNAGVFGQEIVLDRAHQPSLGACGFIRQLFLVGKKLRAKVELTEFGVESIKKRGFIYVSAEFADNYVDNEERKEHGPTLLGAGLTPRPVIKHLDPIRLSEHDPAEGVPTYVSPRIIRLLQEDFDMDLKELMHQLRKRLSEFNLAEAVITQLMEMYETVAKTAADKEIQTQLMEAFAEQGKALAESINAGETEIKVDFSGLDLSKLQGGKALSEDDINKLLDKRDQAREAQAKELQESLESNKAAFTKALDEAEALEGLPDDMRETLLSAGDLITADMTEQQVKALADQQLKVGQGMVARLKLSQQGYQTASAGTTHISVDDSNTIKALQESVDKRLGLTDLPDSRRYERTGGQLSPENKAFADKVLAQFDAEHGAQLHAEHKLLAGGDGIVSDVNVPASFERTVIREALYNLVSLQFLDVGTLAFNGSHQIPYSYRDTAAAGRDDTRIHEGGSIQRAGVIQTSDTAYPIPQKVAFEVSDELRYLTSNGQLQWNAATENQRNASRIIAEDTEQLAFNELLRASDEYNAIAVSNENLELQADDTNNVFVLDNFPVVRPRKVYDLQGNQVGNTLNPVTVTYNAVQLVEYDGTGTQAAGTYYVLDYNLGEIYLVDESGAIQTPANATAYTISYSYATNVAQFDTDEGSTELDVYWDGFLYRYGLRKAVIEDTRHYMANFGVMSGNLMTSVEQAKKFGANYSRPGTDLQSNGNLGRVKDVPNFKTTAPGLWMGDQRAIIGERGTTRFRMLKPWTMGELENQKDANGRFTGKKEAYGDQFIIMHTPTNLKQAYTSIVTYSSSGRAARVNP